MGRGIRSLRCYIDMVLSAYGVPVYAYSLLFLDFSSAFSPTFRQPSGCVREIDPTVWHIFNIW
jgi:hypothetical protein